MNGMVTANSDRRQRPIVRADILWKELLESFLYSALEIFYPQLYAVVDFNKPPSFLNKELRVPGLHKASKEQRILDLLSDLSLKSGELVRLLLHVEVEGARGARVKMKEPFQVRMHNYACAITLTQKRPFASLAIRTTPQGRNEKLSYEMDCFGTRHIFEYPTVFIEQLDDNFLLELHGNPVALATLCAKRMLKAKKDESKRYEYAKELLKIMRSAGYTEDTYIRLAQFIEGMSNLSANKWVNGLKNEIDNLLVEVKSMDVIRTPILRKAVRKRVTEIFRADGLSEGRAEGRAEGRIEGLAEAKKGIAKRMFANGMPLDVIAQMTDFSIEELGDILR